MGSVLSKAALAGVSAIVSIGSFTANASAAAVVYEPFSYSTGAVAGQTPSGYIDEWSIPSNFSAGHSVVGSNLTYADLSTSGNAVNLQSAIASERIDFPQAYFNYDTGPGAGSPTAPNGVFFSFLMKVNMTPGTSTAENYFAGMNQFTDATTSATPQGWGGMMFIRRGASDPNNTYQVGIVKNNRAAGSVALLPTPQSVPAYQIGWDSTARYSGDTILVVGQYVFNTRANISDDTVNLWVNPNLGQYIAPTPTATTSIGSDNYAASGNPSVINNFVTSFLFRSTNSNWPGTITVDELRVGLSYEDVTVPEPASLSLLALGSLALGRRRRTM
jgi:hypothetical protein